MPVVRRSENDDTAAVLRHALTLLNPRQREILALVAWEDLTVADAGRAIGVPPGTARRHLHEARTALRRAVKARAGGEDMFKRDIAAALYAVKGDLATARDRLAVSNLAPGADPRSDRARIEKLKAIAKARGEKYTPPAPPTAEQRKEITDNHIWTNAVDAPIAAPDNPQVRAGVLRVMATMPRVKVTETTTAGRPTLTLTDSWTVNGGQVETLVLDAATGQPVALSSSGSDVPPVTVYHRTSRVTLADVEAGRF
ncbi:sigma-70 family RNA polymerase sigma factor [Actinocorallia longicatena]|uniref:RNA polymerase sigma factor 70 region 4 type 2 domain-containing protein n=1 Tax=Actinocorallia longicatena TaxID=111803 RepID=A0ABP6Q7V9_9ACTN